MGLSVEQCAFAKDLAKLILYINEQGYSCAVGEVYRTPEQAAIYAKQGVGIVNSLHRYKLAADLLLFKNGAYLTTTEDYRFAGQYWESLNTKNRWGGDWNKNDFTDKGDTDGNHFERRA